MKLFFSYLHSVRYGILLFFLSFLLLAFSFFLYRLPAAAVLYPFLLCLVLGIVFLVCGYFREKQRYALLLRQKNAPASLLCELPVPKTLTEEELCAAILRLQQESTQRQADSDAAYAEMIDYYTVWAHQIKTPIASMKLTLQNEDSPLSRRLSSDLFRIGQYADMVLAYLRLDSTDSDYVFRDCALDDIVRSAVRRFAQEFILRRLRVTVEPTGKTVLTDEKWLSFVIEQLLSNALKYTREGGITISMLSENVLSIADTGIGIAPEDLPRIFEKGFTGCSGRTDKSASGIGLYLCRRVCSNLGIGIRAGSEVGRGTQILLTFPEKRTVPE